MRITTAIFDLDGTLIDSIYDIADAINDTLDEFGLEKHSYKTIEGFIGDGFKITINRATANYNLESDVVEKIFIVAQKRYLTYQSEKTKVYDGINEVLNKLDEMDIKKIVFTNKPHHIAIKTVPHFFPNYEFVNITGASIEWPRKPDPTKILEILDELKIEPAECIFLGDSNVDMEVAIRAGFYPIGCNYGYRSKEELLDSGAKLTVDNPIELIDFISKNKN